MSAQMRGTEPSREFRLEGMGLALVGGILAVALLGSFFLGRWSAGPSKAIDASQASGADPLANVMDPDGTTDVEEGLNFFDTVEGGEKQAEPVREMPETTKPVPAPVASRPKSGTAPPAGGQGPATTASGSFWVQVWAGRDHSAAAGLVQRLESEGRSVKLHTQRDGSDSLFKVRVGGYATREAAKSVAEELQDGGYSGAWVTEI